MLITTFLPAYLVFVLGLISPGPDLAITVHNSVRHGWRAGMLTALGIGLAISIHLAYINIGLGALIAHSIVAFTVLKVGAAAYLIYLGIRGLRRKPAIVGADIANGLSLGGWAAFRQGFVTNVLNPKAALFFLSLFTVVLQPDLPASAAALFGGAIMLTAFLWFTLVAFLFTRPVVRQGFLRLGHWFDRLTGAILVALGIRVALLAK